MYRLLFFVLAASIFTAGFASAKILGIEKVKNGFVFDKDEDPDKIDISVIDEVEANKLFKEFSNNKDLALKYTLEGCFARATVMAQQAEKKGIFMGRLYAEGLLQVKTGMSDYPLAQMRHHIAPVVYVKEPNGKTAIKVFDPAFFNKPVTMDEWKAKLLVKTNDQKPEINRLYFGSRFQYSTRWRGEKDMRENVDAIYKDSWVDRDLNDPKTGALAVLRENRRKVDDEFMRNNPRPRIDDSSEQ
jgi:hypothetical protein